MPRLSQGELTLIVGVRVKKVPQSIPQICVDESLSSQAASVCVRDAKINIQDHPVQRSCKQVKERRLSKREDEMINAT